MNEGKSWWYLSFLRMAVCLLHIDQFIEIHGKEGFIKGVLERLESKTVTIYFKDLNHGLVQNNE